MPADNCFRIIQGKSRAKFFHSTGSKSIISSLQACSPPLRLEHVLRFNRQAIDGADADRRMLLRQILHGLPAATNFSADRNGPVWAERKESEAASTAERFKPSADIDLGMGFAAVVPRVGSFGSFFGPFEDCKLRVATVDHNPPHRFLILDTTNLTPINRVDHRAPSCNLLSPSAGVPEPVQSLPEVHTSVMWERTIEN